MAISDAAIGDHALGDISGAGSMIVEFPQGFYDFVESAKTIMTVDTPKGIFYADSDMKRVTVDL